ncbi:MAG: hypothetical protein LAN64_07130 [Acidobacteriia bacterium]|nr:hypothetical protein [Terriglobia bacterium]
MKARVAIVILLSVVVVATVWGQQDAPQNPPMPSPATQDQTAPPDADAGVALVPDNRPLSGAQAGGLGVPASEHSNVVFGFAASETVNSNSNYVAGSQNAYNGGANVAGNVQMSEYWRRGQLFYQGAASYNSQRDEVFQTHRVLVSEKFVGRRVSFLLSNQFGYTPATDFGSAGMEGLLGMNLGGGISGFGSLPQGAASAGVATLNSSYIPNQSILTAPSARIDDTTVGELEYRLNFRNSVTLTGSYGLLHPINEDLLDTRQYNANFGYNYLVSPRTTMAWAYGYTRMDFSALDRAIDSHTVSMMYGRTLVGQLRFTADVGAQFYNIDDPLTSQHDITWSSHAGLAYAIGKTSLNTDWMRSVSAGSGVLPGAQTNSVTFRAGRRIASAWNVLVTGGYAHNTGLGTQQSFETEYAGVGVNRRFGRYLGMYFNYNLQHQKGSAACTAQGCGIAFQQHVFSIGFNWTSRPIGIF